MSDAFENRLREAVVVIDAARVAAMRDGIAALASVRETVQGTLMLVRLAHGLPVNDADRARFFVAASEAGLPIEPGQAQLAATVAMLTMIERFAAPLARRTLNTLSPDAAAAGAIVVLSEQGRESAHPDLTRVAKDWLALAAEYLRGTGRSSAPPELTKQPAATPPTEGEAAAAPPQIGVVEIVEHSEKLTAWLRLSSSSAKIAALEEQQDISWWLMSARRRRGSVDAVVSVVEELWSLAINPIGPPGVDELLERALGQTLEAGADKSIPLGDLASVAARPIPDELHGICSLVTGRVVAEGVSLAPHEAAVRIYHELQLIEIVRPPEAA